MEPWIFVKAVFSEWIGFVGGILSLTPFVPDRARKWIEARIMKDEFSLKHLWKVGILLLLIASYDAWRDEHNNTKQVIAEKAITVSQMEFWKAQSYDKDAAIRTRDGLLECSAPR